MTAIPRAIRTVAIALAAAVTVAGVPGCAHPLPAPPGAIVVALANSPTNLDPGVALDEASQKLQQLLFSSLLKIDASLRVVPDLASRFEATDARTYVAEIPHGVHFHDGREMTSEDVAFTFRRFLDPAFASGRKGAYRNLRAVDVLDRYTVAFRLTDPAPSFPINLVMSIVPVGTGAEASRHPIGSGPYRLVEFVPDDHVTLSRFDEYYRGPAANPGLLFRIVPDDTMRGLELRNGSVDLVVNDLAPDLVAGLRAERQLQVLTAPGTDYAYLGFNLRDPALKDVRVRQAIGYAIDIDAIVTYLRRGLAVPATGIVPAISWAFAPDAFRFSHDPDKARALLTEAGYPDPGGGAPRLHLTLETSTAEPYRLQASVIQQNLSEAGIAVEVRSYEFATLMADVLGGQAQMYTLQWVGATDPDILRRVFHSSQVAPNGFNRGYYRNTTVDHLIDEAAAAMTEESRREFYQAAERAIAIDAPYVSLWTKTNVVVAQASIAGITISPTADFSFLAHVSKTDPGGRRMTRP